jgi:hypothetical protein
LDIATPENRKSVSSCLWRGWWQIKLPVLALIVICSGGLILMMKHFHGPDITTTTIVGHDPGPLWGAMMFVPLFVLVVLIPISPAWLWWSCAAPRWRIWALRNVDDWALLEQSAVKDGLIWRRHSIFNLTEIKSSAQKQLERKLVAYRDIHG